MTIAIAERETQAVTPIITADQLDLVRRTIAKDATPDELKLYLYDCVRQGVHPLDKLIHFTKRSGKYTPVTSIDFMRIRAGDTGEYAGNDDATFSGEVTKPGWAAHVTVWRFVQGQRCPFSATARWDEYKPDQDFMWRKMPHTMLAKCAEALALRKGFPRQLAGLYAKEEMDQAETRGSYAVEAPAAAATAASSNVSGARSAPNGGDSGTFTSTRNTGPESDALTIRKIETNATRNKNIKKYFIVLSDGRELTTIKDQLGALCEQLCQENAPVVVETKETQWGVDLTGIHRVKDAEAEPTEPDDPIF